MVRDAAPIDGLLGILERLVAQARAYERALPANAYPARAAVAVLGEMARQALNEARDLADVDAVPISEGHPFTVREMQVLALAGQGLTNKEIAYRLGISDRTVQYHMATMFGKTGTESRTELVALALRNGWLSR